MVHYNWLSMQWRSARGGLQFCRPQKTWDAFSLITLIFAVITPLFPSTALFAFNVHFRRYYPFCRYYPYFSVIIPPYWRYYNLPPFLPLLPQFLHYHPIFASLPPFVVITPTYDVITPCVVITPISASCLPPAAICPPPPPLRHSVYGPLTSRSRCRCREYFSGRWRRRWRWSGRGLLLSVRVTHNEQYCQQDDVEDCQQQQPDDDA